VFGTTTLIIQLLLHCKHGGGVVAVNIIQLSSVIKACGQPT